MAKDYIPYGLDPATVGRRSATRSRTDTRGDQTGQTFHHDEVIVVNNRIVTYEGVGSTFRMQGNAATTQGLWGVENTTGSTVRVALRRLYVAAVQSASVAAVAYVILTRVAAPLAGGTAFTKVNPDGSSADTSVNNVRVVQGASADGTLTNITTAPAGSRLAAAIIPNLLTSGAQFTDGIDVLENITDSAELVLGAGQAYLLQLIGLAAADNPATRHHIVDFAWEEFTEF